MQMHSFPGAWDRFLCQPRVGLSVQVVKSAVSGVWAVYHGPRSLPPSCSTWAWPCSVGVATRL